MNYTLMNKTVPILDFVLIDTATSVSISKILNVYHSVYLPVGIPVKKGMPDKRALEIWWTGRAIPASREGLKEVLGNLKIKSQYHLLSKSYGLSLSDQYWINPIDSPLKWQDINFFHHPFSEDLGNAFFSKIDFSQKLDLLTPDNTSDGWLKKKWKIMNGQRYLIKAGSAPYFQEPYNEVLATAIYRRLLHDHVEYKLIVENGLPNSICKNFITEDTELVTAYQVYSTAKKLNHVSHKEHLQNCAKQLGICGTERYLNFILTTDFIIGNTDRHLNNFGFIRDINTLEFIKIAPTYDSGTSMYLDVQERFIDTNKPILSKPFRKTHQEQIKLVNSFEDIQFSKLEGLSEEFNEILKNLPGFISDERRNVLCRSLEQNLKALELEIDQRYQNKSICVDMPEPEDDGLLGSTENVIVQKIKELGYLPTSSLISNIKALNHLNGSEVDINNLKIYGFNEQEQILVNRIREELSGQKKEIQNINAYDQEPHQSY